MSLSTAAQDAEAAMRLADHDPGPALPVAEAAALRAHREHDDVAAAVAERAVGHCLIHCGRMTDAIRHLRSAITCGDRAGSPVLAAEARHKLAFALMQRGRAADALAEADAALLVLTGSSGARARAQRAIILHLSGRLDESLAEYGVALRVLRRTGDVLGLQKMLINRSFVHVDRHAFGAAEADLRQAEELARELGRELTIGIIAEKLGWLETLRGDVPAALEHLDRAVLISTAHGAGTVTGNATQNRAELLLSVGLLGEAREAAELAVAAFLHDDRELRAAETRLLLAQVAFLERDWPAAQEHARRAQRELTRQQRPEWAELARLAVLRAQLAAGSSPRLTTDRADEMVRVLDRAGWPAAALEARLVAAGLAQRRGDTSGTHLAAAGRTAGRRGPATLRARGWYARAVAARTAGDTRRAAAAVRAGLRVLDEHRAGLGSTDLRVHAALHRVELAELGLRMALDRGRPDRVFEWAERSRASHLLHRPVRPPADPELADLLSQLRATVAEIDRQQSAGAVRSRRQAHQIELERRIRDHSRLHRATPDGRLPGPVSPARLAAALGDWALVEFVLLDGTLHVLTAVDGRVRLRTLGPVTAISSLLERVPFGLLRLARPDTRNHATAQVLAMVRGTAAELDARLLRPLPELADRPLVVVPTGPLHGMPWSLLPSCAGRPLTVVPSATLWHATGERAHTGAGSLLVAAGPKLTGAVEEAAAVAAIHHTTALVDGAATVDAVLDGLATASLAHLAAHGRLSPDNPLFSDLLLDDGPLVLYDLDGLASAPHTVVLAACNSGRSVVRTGDELLGLSAAFIARGTAQLVASVVPVPDAETAPLMAAFHRRLAAGRAAATALAEAQVELSGGEPAAVAAAAGFVCIGYGRVPPPGMPA